MVGVGSCVHIVFPKANVLWDADEKNPLIEKDGTKKGEELRIAVNDVPKTRGIVERSAKRSITGHQGIETAEELANANKRLAVGVGFESPGFGNLSACLRPGAAAGNTCTLSSAAVTDLSMLSMTSKELNLKVQAEDAVDDVGMPEIATPGIDDDLVTGNDVNNSRTPLDIA